jgi:hypothetical protein
MNMTISGYRHWRSIIFLFLAAFEPLGLCADLPTGKVIWWGWNAIPRAGTFDRTNGVVERNGQILTNAAAVAAGQGIGLVLAKDGTVHALGLDWVGETTVPAGLSNVVSVAVEGLSCWALKRDGTVVRWGNREQDSANLIAGLSNVTAIAAAANMAYLALKSDGTVLGVRLRGDTSTNAPHIRPGVRPVQVGGRVLSNVAAIASMDYHPLILRKDGAVLRLQFPDGPLPGEITVDPADGTQVHGNGAEPWRIPWDYTSMEPVIVGGQPLTNVTALAGGGTAGYALALKRNGSVVGWGSDLYGVTAIPPGLNNVTAIAADGRGFALKPDGTVVSWGGTGLTLTPIPAGLTNVVAIAAGGACSLAITTGPVPASVYAPKQRP